MLEERLLGILQAGEKRLRERMLIAKRRGRLDDYLRSIGLVGTEGEKDREAGVFDSACELLEQKIRHSRRKGYLKDYLGRVGMSDLLWRRRGRLVCLSGGGKIRAGNFPRPRLVLVG